MSNPTDTFPSDLDPEAFLAQMYGGGPFMPWGMPPTPNRPSLASAIAALDAGPPSLARSLIAMGYAPPTAIPDPNLPNLQPTLGPQEMLFGGPGLPATANAPPPSNLPSLAQSMARLSTPPGFYKSPALMGSGTPTPSLDPSLTPAIGSQMMLFGGPGLPSRSNAPPVSPGFIPAGFSTPFPPPTTGPQATFPAGGPSLIPAQASPPMAPPSPTPQPPIADSYDPESENWRGYELVLPDGSTIADDPTIAPDDPGKSRSPTGHVMTPYLNLGEVAAAGRQAGEEYRRQLTRPAGGGALPALLFNAFRDVATGGRFDYQRKGNQLAGLVASLTGGFKEFEFTQLRQFRPISNINVGLWSQQAGLTLEETLKVAGEFARMFSSNADSKSQYGLPSKTEHYIREGYGIGQSGVFDQKNASADTSSSDPYQNLTSMGYPFARTQPFPTGEQAPTVPSPGGQGWYEGP